MNYYRMSRKIEPNGASLYQDSHDLFLLKTGHKLEEGFEPPFRVVLDTEMPNGKLPTFFESPAWIGTKSFYRDLRAIGIGNIEAVPVKIRDTVRNRVINNYLLLNIVGIIACADLTKTRRRSLGEGMIVIDRLVINISNIGNLDLFVAEEDTDCMIISERIFRHLSTSAYGDILFEALEQT